MAAKRCEQCDTNAAAVWVTATDANGIVLERLAICVECADGMGLQVGGVSSGQIDKEAR